MLVPSRTENVELVAPGGVDERIWLPGAATSGFSSWPKSVGPADEKLVTIPLRPFTISLMLRPTRIVVRPPTEAR